MNSVPNRQADQNTTDRGVPLLDLGRQHAELKGQIAAFMRTRPGGHPLPGPKFLEHPAARKKLADGRH